MPTGQSFAAGNAGIAMTFSIRKDDSQFDAAIEEARRDIAKRLAGIPAKIARIETTDAIGRAVNDIKQGIERNLNITTKGSAATSQLLQQGISLEAIEKSGKYGKAGGAEIRAAEMRLQQQLNTSEFSGTFSARAGFTAAAARARGHGPAWAGGDYAAPASVGMEPGTGGPENQPTKLETMIDGSLRFMARRGPLVAAVVAAAMVSNTVGAAVMQGIVRATHSGYSAELGQSAATWSMQSAPLRALGSIPLLGSAFSAMAQRGDTMVQWAQEAAKENAVGPFQAQGMRFAAAGDQSKIVRANRAAGAAELEASYQTAVEKWKESARASGHLGSTEASALERQMDVASRKLSAYRQETQTLIAVADKTQEAMLGGFQAGAISARQSAGIAGMKMSGGSPIDIFTGELGVGYRGMLAGQASEAAGLVPGMIGYKEMMAKQSAERGNFMAQSRWQAMQFAYSAPDAYTGSAGEAIGQAEISSLRMGQAQQLGNDAVPVLEAILEEMKRLNPTAFGQVQ